MVLPNFLLIGTAKGGTTSLYSYLDQHPQVYMSANKEPGFFALEGEKLDYQGPDEAFSRTSVTHIEAYKKLFEGVTTETAIGEASPFYLYFAKAPERIKHYAPNAKLIVSLRNPVDRAYASYMHNVRVGYEEDSFEASLKKEDRRIQDNWIYLWHYKQCGLYYQQLSRYFDTFGRDQIQVHLFEDLAQTTQTTVQSIFSFLQIDDTFVPDLSIVNASGIPRSKLVHSLVDRGNPVRDTLKAVVPDGLRKGIANQIRKLNLAPKPPLDPETKAVMVGFYREDILKLQDLIGRDLTGWL
ncbi:MAG: sulfotransferase [Cyanobacteria bacterium J06621_11]